MKSCMTRPSLVQIYGVSLADVHSFGTETGERYEVEVHNAVLPPEPHDAGGVRVDAVYEVHSAEERRPQSFDADLAEVRRRDLPHETVLIRRAVRRLVQIRESRIELYQ